MNTPSPLVPQGTMPARGKSTFFFKVLMILTVHVVLIGGMLLQGCKDTKDTSQNPPDNSATATTTDTLPPLNSGTSNAAPNAPQNLTAQPSPATPGTPMAPAGAPGAPMVQTPPGAQTMQPPAIAPVEPPAAPVAETKEYVIASGDTLGAIAHRNGVALKALMEANPGINPKKLKVGQKIELPAGAGSVASTAGGGAAPDMSATGDTTTYTVKSGDTLTRIAKSHHTTYKKIMAMNNLKTTSIKVGQKLQLPVKAPEATETPAASTAVVPLQPPPASTTTAATTPTTAAN